MRTDIILSILLSTPGAAIGWGDSLQAMLEADPRTRDSIWQGVSLSLFALADPRVMGAVSPRDGESFGPETFLSEKGTLHLLATGAGSNNSAALASTFVEDLVETDRRTSSFKTTPASSIDESSCLGQIHPNLAPDAVGRGVRDLSR